MNDKLREAYRKHRVPNPYPIEARQALAMARFDLKTYPVEFAFESADGGEDIWRTEFELAPFVIKVRIVMDTDCDLSHYGEFKWQHDMSYNDDYIHFGGDDEEGQNNLRKLKELAGHETHRQWWNGWPKYFVRGNPENEKERLSNIEYWVCLGMNRHDAECMSRDRIWQDIKALLRIWDNDVPVVGICVDVFLEDEEMGHSSCWGYELSSWDNDDPFLISETWNHIETACREAVRCMPEHVLMLEQQLTKFKYHLLMIGDNATPCQQTLGG